MTKTETFSYSEFLIPLMAGDRRRCSRFVRDFLENNPSLVGLYENLFKLSLYEVGRMWEQNLISVATEHLSTALIEGLLNEVYERIVPRESNGRQIVAACVENETHQVGIKMVADVFEMYGWNSHFIGSSIPTGELLRYTSEVQPDLFAFSLSIVSHIPRLENMLNRIRTVYPGTPIVLGGQAFFYGAEELLTRYSGLVHLPDLPAVEQYIRSSWRH